MIDLSPLAKHFGNKPLAILGLGKSGMPVFQACQAAGIKTILWDDNAERRAEAEKEGATVADFAVEDMHGFAGLCISPGIPLYFPKPHRAVVAAQKAGIEILGDMELFHRALPRAKAIGITGTNGKSTTTALIGHILQQAGVSCAVGGNIGQAVLTLPMLPSDGIYVIEMSSYQLDLCKDFAPDIGILINIDPDHLDRHGSMENYVAAKTRIFSGKGVAICGIDDGWASAVDHDTRHEGQRKCISVSTEKPLPHGIYVSNEGMMFDGAVKIVDINTCRALRGVHNWQNAAMAYAACREAGIKPEAIVRGMHSFPGLAHRQNIVAVINGITYINDSKATNDQAASMALRTYGPIYWIAGGKSKGAGYPLCEKYLSHVHHAFLVGAAEDELAEWLTAKRVPFTRCGTVEKAVERAHHLAELEKLPQATVLLSPACASLDQFRSFEHRGEVFADLVSRFPVKAHAAGAHL